MNDLESAPTDKQLDIEIERLSKECEALSAKAAELESGDTISEDDLENLYCEFYKFYVLFLCLCFVCLTLYLFSLILFCLFCVCYLFFLNAIDIESMERKKRCLLYYGYNHIC